MQYYLKGLAEFKTINMANKGFSDQEILPLIETIKNDLLITELSLSGNQIKVIFYPYRITYYC